MGRLNECGCNSNTDHSSTENYMFFQNLKTIKKMVDAMLQMDPSQVDQMLSDGHGWAVDHIATSKDDVEEVGGFLMGADDSYNSQQPKFTPVDFKNHMIQLVPERIEHSHGKWIVKPSRGNHILGTHPTKKAALKQLAAIEISKHRK